MCAPLLRLFCVVGACLALAACRAEVPLPRADSDPAGWCQEITKALAQSDAARLEALFVGSATETTAEAIEKVRDAAAAVHRLASGSLRLLTDDRPLEYRDSSPTWRHADGRTVIIDRWQGRNGKDLFFGCALGKAGDGRNDFSFEISTRRSEVERKLLKGHGKRRPGTDAIST